MNKPKIIQIIDVVSNAIAGNRIDEDFIKSCIYGKVDAELYAHLLGKYRGYDGDFFQFYLGTDDRINRALLENLGIKVEPDKYPDLIAGLLRRSSRERKGLIFILSSWKPLTDMPCLAIIMRFHA